MLIELTVYLFRILDVPLFESDHVQVWIATSDRHPANCPVRTGKLNEKWEARRHRVDNHVIMISQIRSFEEMLEELPADNAIDLKTSLATCKLLDLMLALSMEEFQM